MDRRQPAILSLCAVHMSHAPSLQQISQISRTGSAKDTGDLDELDGLLIHFRTWFRRLGVGVCDGCRLSDW